MQEGFMKPLWGETSHFKSSDFNCGRFCLCLRLEKEEPVRQWWWHLAMISWALSTKPIHCSISAGCPRSRCWCWPVPRSVGKALASPELFSSNWSLTTFWQGTCISIGKCLGAAGQESLKTIALVYWSRNSHIFSPIITFALLQVCMTPVSKALALDRALSSLNFLIIALLSPFPWLSWGSDPCDLYLTALLQRPVRASCGSWPRLLVLGAASCRQHCSYWGAGTDSLCCVHLLPSSGLIETNFGPEKAEAETVRSGVII